MRKPYERDIKKEILEKCFMYLVQKGLEQASIKNLCEETGISSGSIYYWFKDRNEVILDSAEYGINMVAEKLFDYALSNSESLQTLLNKFPDKLMLYKKELRFIYQATTSEQFGANMRLMIDELKDKYNSYGKRLSEQLQVPFDKLKPWIYLFISSILTYIVWEDREIMQTEIGCICKSVEKIN